MNWYLKAMKQYATFGGRAQRAEYWYFVLFYALGIILLSFVDAATGTFNKEAGIGLLSALFIFAHLIPSIAVSIRRLHDIGRSGWWYLLVFIPVAGPLVLLFFSVQDSTEDNEYGPNPKKIS